MLLDGGPGNNTQWELFSWLLVARGVYENCQEVIHYGDDLGWIRLTWPAPHQMRRLLNLTGEDLGKWTYHTQNAVLTRDLFTRTFEGVR